ncbi:MAG: VPGUxxT family thioredoxin-like (seleno)protein, type 2 [Bradymonadaceae bacterium]
MVSPTSQRLTVVSALLAVGTWALATGHSTPARAGDDRVELGEVDWLRDFERAKERSRESGKPLFVLFTEVPGCSTVRGYGRRVLANRLVADAIEEAFVPVAIFNNKKGEDRRVLESFGEPTWNNPAVRIVGPDREAHAPRLYGDYSVAATVRTMIRGLENADREVPTYLELLAREKASKGHRETALFGMYCFWSGEAALGRLEGVIRTRPGFLEGGEVVEVTYDSSVTSLSKLARRARQRDAAARVFVRDRSRLDDAREVFGKSAAVTDDSFEYAADDDNHALEGTVLESLRMTPLQTTRVNSAVAAARDPSPYLSPSQRRTAQQTH